MNLFCLFCSLKVVCPFMPFGAINYLDLFYLFLFFCFFFQGDLSNLLLPFRGFSECHLRGRARPWNLRQHLTLTISWNMRARFRRFLCLNGKTKFYMILFGHFCFKRIFLCKQTFQLEISAWKRIASAVMLHGKPLSSTWIRSRRPWSGVLKNKDN